MHAVPGETPHPFLNLGLGDSFAITKGSCGRKWNRSQALFFLTEVRAIATVFIAEINETQRSQGPDCQRSRAPAAQIDYSHLWQSQE